MYSLLLHILFIVRCWIRITKQADIQYWDDTLTEEIETIKNMIRDIPSLHGVEQAAMLDRANGRLRSAKGTKRSYKMEIRLVQDVAKRRSYEQRLGQLDQQLKSLTADCKALESETQRGELFIDGNGGPEGPATNGMDPTKAGDSMLKEAHGLQDKTQDSLSNTKQMIAESKDVGASTLEELQRQRQVIQSIETEIDRVDDNLARAEVLLKQFGKRMASDHFIQCFAVINCLLFVGVLVYAIVTDKDLNPLANPSDPTSVATEEATATADASTTAAAGAGRLLFQHATNYYLRTRQSHGP